MTHPLFVTVGISLILGNTVILAFKRFDNTPSTIDSLKIANRVFTYIFLAEMVFKIWCLGGVKGYVRDPFNIFDGTLVLISLVDEIIEMLPLEG